jgi:hypothetical protein
VVLALEKARGLGAREVELVLDSQLVVEQLAGRWKVRHPAIKPLADRAHALLAGLDHWSIRHERRASNRAADALANLALDDPAAAAAVERGELAPPVRDQPSTSADPQMLSAYRVPERITRGQCGMCLRDRDLVMDLSAGRGGQIVASMAVCHECAPRAARLLSWIGTAVAGAEV